MAYKSNRRSSSKTRRTSSARRSTRSASRVRSSGRRSSRVRRSGSVNTVRIVIEQPGQSTGRLPVVASQVDRKKPTGPKF